MVRIKGLTVNLSYSNAYYTYEGVLTEEQALEIQEEHGKHPHGYGFFNHKVKNGITTWDSFNCCD